MPCLSPTHAAHAGIDESTGQPRWNSSRLAQPAGDFVAFTAAAGYRPCSAVGHMPRPWRITKNHSLFLWRAAEA